MPIARIDSVMTSYPYVIELDALAATARTMMQQLKVRHLPVREGDKVVGVVTEQALQMAEACGRDLTGSGIKVRDLCSKNVLLVAPEESLESVLRKMAEKHIEVALILRQGRLAGIFTTTDACRRFADSLTPAASPAGKPAFDL
ncbi:MAG: CBS domain-containing protein [Pseudomonadota bacterium]